MTFPLYEIRSAHWPLSGSSVGQFFQFDHGPYPDCPVPDPTEPGEIVVCTAGTLDVIVPDGSYLMTDERLGLLLSWPHGLVRVESSANDVYDFAEQKVHGFRFADR